MNKSTHRAEVVPIVLEKHPNADSLSIVKLFDGGFQVIVRTSDWVGKNKGIYIQPDSIVPDTEQFAFLDGKFRIKARKLRGQWSMGLLISAPDNAEIDQDYAEELGIVRYEPILKITMGESESVPGHIASLPKYDVESLRRYSSVFVPGEKVLITEKIHGANGRWLWDGERFYCGSRSEWKKESESNLWWKALKQCEPLQNCLKEFPNVVAYGEVYGQVQDLKYGLNGIQLVIFDFFDFSESEWQEAMVVRRVAATFDVPNVPLVDITEFDLEKILAMAEGNSFIPTANHLREGIVVKPLVERWDPEVGRVCLKVVSNSYLERS